MRVSVQLCSLSSQLAAFSNDFLADSFKPLAGFQVCCRRLRRSLAAIFITTLLLFRLACPRKYGGSEDGIRGRLGVIRHINMDYGVHGEAVSVVGG